MASPRVRMVMVRIATGFFVISLIVITAIKVIYGGGARFPEPHLPPARLALDAAERVAQLPTPVLAIAAAPSGRLFFGLHVRGTRVQPLVEWVDGSAQPYPPLDKRVEGDALHTVSALALDAESRLWVLDHGEHGLYPARLVAFNLSNGARVHDFELPRALAPRGSYLSDLAVTRDGRTVVMADASYVARQPALVIYDSQRREARRLLERDVSVVPERYTPRVGRRRMELFGLISVRPGVDALAISADERWLSWAVPSQTGLARVMLSDLRNTALTAEQLSRRVDVSPDKPFSEGLVALPGGDWVTAAPISQKIVRLNVRGQRESWVEGALGWPGALELSADGHLYWSDKAIDRTAGRLPLQVSGTGPYPVYRIRAALP
ncbi:L-dopachrome tautomerase-related protein [Polycyclovorans algicola]|uniref:L-dopachrome tautomerase-related protein n=1 Tax=Polycyclovorans algicola TaxID=616992 RepID=UPI0004A740F8|nr:L-dopachrome tautomerase-related protein [Polycyclovorans algicola]